jgi:signal transduction histidine kinase
LVIYSLAGNSIKFTSEGEVIVSASVRSRDDENIELLFSVRDTGGSSRAYLSSG